MLAPSPPAPRPAPLPGALPLAVALLAVYGVCAAMSAQLEKFPEPRVVAAAISFDLTLTAGGLAWWLGVCRAGLPWLAVPATVALGATLAHWVPHAPERPVLAVAAAAELALAALLISRAPRLWRTVREHEMAGPIGALEAGLCGVGVPRRLASIVAGELGVLRLALGAPFRRFQRGDARLFSMRRTNYLAIAPLLGWLIVAETVAAHLLIARASELAAWLASASSAYALLWLTADWHAVRLHPIAVTADALWLRVGVRWHGEVPRTDVIAVRAVTSRPADALALHLLEPNLVIEFGRPVTVRGPFGLTRHGRLISLTIDEPERLAAALGHPFSEPPGAPPARPAAPAT